MSDSVTLMQKPEPGKAVVMFCGDCIRFVLEISHEIQGHAWIRTNLGRASVARKEIIEKIDSAKIKVHEEWHDIRMIKQTSTVFSICLPLNESGRFQAKCFFLTENDAIPLWPVGENTIINVESPGCCCANIIYNAFVRQFGNSKYFTEIKSEREQECLKDLDKKGFTVIPYSGKFRDLAKEIDFIFSELGCRVLQLLPIHPTPTTYARMGRFGSPYAALNFTDVDPGLAEFDPAATPMEQFLELVDKVHFYSGYIFLDIAINHTGWAAVIHDTHPEWLVRGKDGKIEVPGAWGVEWADLTKLDYSKIDLWQYMADIFLFWCRKGIDGFRCDAGYMIPMEAWEYIVARVRQEYSDIIFFLEGLGGGIDATRNLLDRANFNWAYSELFQNYDKHQIKTYLASAFDFSEKYGHMIHFAETHDNPRLAAVSTDYAKMRTSISALFSICGGFGFANGVEWFAKEKIDVHEAASLNWGDEENQVSHIKRLNTILQTHPCFANFTDLKFIEKGDNNTLVLSRHHRFFKKIVFVLVNLESSKKQKILWESCTGEPAWEKRKIFYDLITGKTIIPDIVTHIDKDLFCLELNPYQVFALSPDKTDVDELEKAEFIFASMPERVRIQKLRAKVLKILTVLRGYGDIGNIGIDKAANDLACDPVEFIRSLNPLSSESKVIIWRWEKDIQRTVMVPPGFFLMVVCDKNFRAEIIKKKTKEKAIVTMASEEGLALEKGGFFAIFAPLETQDKPKEYFLKIRVFEKNKSKEEKGKLFYPGNFDSVYMKCCFTRDEIVADPSLKLLAATKTGGMMRAAAWWARLESKYDALLAANLNSDFPEDRWMVLSRYRIWAEYQGYSRELAPDCLEKFAFSYDCCGKWVFRVPTCEGSYFFLELYLEMDKKDNIVILTVMRKPNTKDLYSVLSDTKQIKIIIRPDIENRNFHDTVKAWTGPEAKWPASVYSRMNGFVFEPEPKHCSLFVKTSTGKFIIKPEWQYMVNRPLEAQRGLDPDSDLFSPGYFTAFLSGNDRIVLTAKAQPGNIHTGENAENKNNRKSDTNTAAGNESVKKTNAANANTRTYTTAPDFFNNTLTQKKELPHFPEKYSFIDAALKSLDAFIVNRKPYQSVIAGYPWFLDWGRDSLIFCRALIEAKRFEHAKNILRLFGRYEKNGTLPNMICGEDTKNRETSDASLWFFASCREIYEKENNGFPDEFLGTRRVKDILFSMAKSIMHGTGTGICMDKNTSLIFSPSHFTWMDTNYPACSPRQGYPVEIQAMWYYALTFLEKLDPSEKNGQWKQLSKNVKNSILKLFFLKDKGFFSDCLHCDRPVHAADAIADDALRPNQLFLITLGVINNDDSDANRRICEKTLETCMELVVPGAVRSLADRRLSFPVKIMHNGELIRDPHYIYSGKYTGDEDRQRKPAYHNGTAWTWLFPVFCEAWAMVFGKRGKDTALALLGSSLSLMKTGCAGYIPEILDGDAPHCPRGCDAQAWGSSELARVLIKLGAADITK